MRILRVLSASLFSGPYSGPSGTASSPNRNYSSTTATDGCLDAWILSVRYLYSVLCLGSGFVSNSTGSAVGLDAPALYRANGRYVRLLSRPLGNSSRGASGRGTRSSLAVAKHSFRRVSTRFERSGCSFICRSLYLLILLKNN